MRLLILAPLILSACTVAPVKDAVEGAVHRRIEARQEQRQEPIQVCSCQTQCSIAEIPKN